jgi:dipeptidyl aminopeptidase/acylaminoacyl peptidase
MAKQPLSFIHFLLSISVAFNAIAQTKNDDSLTVEKAISFYRLSNPVFSPDGNKLAFVVTEPPRADKPAFNHIWLLDLSDNSTRQYTNSPKSEYGPKWSPDGKQLGFLSNRNGENQVFLISSDGGEAVPLTSSKTGVSRFEWSPDGKTIAYIERDSISGEEKKRKDGKFDENIANNDKASVLLTIDVSTKNTRRLFSKEFQINNLKWISSGESLLLETESLPKKEIPELHLVKYGMMDSSFQDIPSLKNPSWSGIEMAPDGKLFSFVGPRADGPIGHDLYLQYVSEGHATNISAEKIDLPLRAIKFLSNDELTAIVQHGFNSRLYSISTKGKATEFNIRQNVLAYDIRPDHTVAFISGSSARLMELWLSRPGQEPIQITHLNKAFEKLVLIGPELVTYKSFDGTPIETLFFRPSKTSGNELLPMVVMIHGGPTGAWADSYQPWAQLFLQKGYAVMQPNIRGSTGYGWKFLESNRKDWGGGDFKDVMSGIDYLIAHKNIDSSKLAIVGWSYGGYMSEWAITQTNRFKAAMSGAGLFNLASEFGTEGGAAYDNWCLGTPYENMDVFARHSAISFVKNAKTPILIIQGEDDDVDPIGQSQELYRALRYYNVPAELVTYPREHHGFVELNHNIDYITRMINWVEKYCPIKY